MPIFSWDLPTPPEAPSSGMSGAGELLSGANQRSGAGMSWLIDPYTLDLIDSDDGWFVEVDDSRTIVMWQLEAAFNAWWGDPSSGSRIRQLMRGDDPSTGADVRNEVHRALQPLVDEQMIADLDVQLDVDELAPHRPVILIHYRDQATNGLVGLAASPLGG